MRTDYICAEIDWYVVVKPKEFCMAEMNTFCVLLFISYGNYSSRSSNLTNMGFVNSHDSSFKSINRQVSMDVYFSSSLSVAQLYTER